MCTEAQMAQAGVVGWDREKCLILFITGARGGYI